MIRLDKQLLFFFGMLAVVFLMAPLCGAQGFVELDPTGRSGDEPFPAERGVGGIERIRPLEPSEEEPLELKEEPLPFAPPTKVLPPVPEAKPDKLAAGRIFVKDIKITGSTVFPSEELAAVAAPYVNRELAAEDLDALRRALTVYYVERGYINSGAVIPEQDVVDGVMTINIVEGELTAIEIEGHKQFRAGYIEDRIRLSAGPPLNIQVLQERLQLLQQDHRVERINAELKPGVKPGSSVLKVKIEEKTPYRLWVGFDNYQSPTVGAERGRAIASHENLTGNGDTLGITYGRSDGIDPEIEAWYSVPFTSHDTTLTFGYRRNDFSVIEQPFEPLDVDSESEIYEVTLRHPFYRTPNQEFSLALSGEHLHNETFMLGEGYSFSLGAEDGESTVTALRLSPEYVYRSQNQVIAARSRFSLGIDALDATIHSDPNIPDGQFFSWLGQFQLARILKPWDTQMILRADIQLSTDPLLPLEQIAIGGRYSVRGYRENQLVRDLGAIASLEFRVPLVRNKPWADYLQLAPFFDFGRSGMRRTIESVRPKETYSAGLGLRWAVTLPPPIRLKPSFELYWGIPFRDFDAPEYNLQDDGIHFQFAVSNY